MFRKSILLIILLVGFVANAQYHPMVEEGKQWNLYYQTMLGTFNSTYQIVGDTVLGGESYKKMFLTNDLNSSPTLSHLLKEDTSQKTVEIRTIPPNGLPPIATLDYSLNLGDTVFADCFSMPWYMIVDSVFQFQLSPGEFRKAMFLEHYDSAFPSNARANSLWIEGLGTFAGPVAVNPTDCLSDVPIPTVLCVKDSTGNTIYDNPDYAQCLVLTKPEQRASDIGFYPNPVRDQLNLENLFLGEHFIVADASGQIVMEIVYQGREIDVSKLAPGLYFLHFDTSESLKFIKE